MFDIEKQIAKVNAEYFAIEQPIGAQVIAPDSPLFVKLTHGNVYDQVAKMNRLLRQPPERYDSGETFERPRMSEDELERRLDDRSRMQDFL